MRRREFLGLVGGAATAWPLTVRAQQGERLRRIGVLMAFTAADPETTKRLAAFRLGLERRGWSEGRNVHIDYRYAPGAVRAEGAAKELLALQPEAILAHSTAIAATLQHESRTIPIVFVNVSDPIGAGFIANLSRPGGNLTGVLHLEGGIVGKWLTMLKEIAPQLARAAILANPVGGYGYFLRSAQAMASSLGVEIVPSPIEDSADIERVVDTFARVPNGGLMIPPDAMTIVHRDLVIALAARHRLPAVYALHVFVAAGGLMSYGTDQLNLFRLAANYVDRILRGDNAADLPVQAPTKYETSVNLKTAKALGLTVPPGLLVAADEVIE